LGHEVTVADILPIAERVVPAAMDGALPVTLRDIPRRAPLAPGVIFDLAPAN
jgi:hypothetical protein